MKEVLIMKHSIKINGEIKEINCQFGTGYFDKNNQEIFEGNKVRNFSCSGEYISRVIFKDGRFFLADQRMLPLDIFWSSNLEIVE